MTDIFKRNNIEEPGPGGGTGGSGDARKGPRPPKVTRETAGDGQAMEKKSLFGGRKKSDAKPPKPKKVKAPKQKKVKPPKPKKVKAPKTEKVKAPKHKKPKKERKPLFGKKKGAEPEAVEPAAAAAVGGEGEGEAKKERKPLFGKKKGKEAGEPKAKKKAGKKKATGKKAKRGGGFGGSKVSPVGLDIGRMSLTACRLKHQTGGSVLLQAALDNLPEGVISEGEVKDVEALGFALRDFWRKHNIKSRKVSLGLANQKVVVRALEFPLLEEKELQSAIEFQAQDYIPIPVEEAVFAHHIMGRTVDDEGVEMQKVLIVAAQKDMVMDYVNAVKKAKLQVAGIDLQAFAMMRSLRPGTFLDQEGSREAIAIANIASDITNIVVDVSGEPQFTRIISFGGDDFTRAVQEHQGIPFPEAELLKIRAGLPEPGATGTSEKTEFPDEDEPFLGGMSPEDLPYRPPEEPGPPEMAPQEPPGPPGAPGVPGFGGETIPPGQVHPAPEAAFGPPPEKETSDAEDGTEQALSEEEQIAQVQRVLEITAETLADELRRSFDYYMSQESAVPISMLLISGGGALLPNIHKHLSQMFPFEVRMGEPIARIVENKSDLTDQELEALAPRLAIAIGLSLEDEESSNA